MSAEPVRRTIIRWGTLGIGVVLFVVTLYYLDFRIALASIRRLGIALPLALLFSGLWHLARTWAWAWCFPQPRRVLVPPPCARPACGGSLQLPDPARDRRRAAEGRAAGRLDRRA